MIRGFKNKLILNIVEARREEKLNNYFFSIPKSEHDKVKYISMDMYNHYRIIMNRYFPEAVICIDSFHVLKKIIGCLNSVKKEY